MMFSNEGMQWSIACAAQQFPGAKDAEHIDDEEQRCQRGNWCLIVWVKQDAWEIYQQIEPRYRTANRILSE